MFERYTEKARRTIFFARYEASRFGTPYIASEHLLLGLLREDKALANRFLRSHAAVESIGEQIEGFRPLNLRYASKHSVWDDDFCLRSLSRLIFWLKQTGERVA